MNETASSSFTSPVSHLIAIENFRAVTLHLSLIPCQVKRASLYALGSSQGWKSNNNIPSLENSLFTLLIDSEVNEYY